MIKRFNDNSTDKEINDFLLLTHGKIVNYNPIIIEYFDNNGTESHLNYIADNFITFYLELINNSNFSNLYYEAINCDNNTNCDKCKIKCMQNTNIKCNEISLNIDRMSCYPNFTIYSNSDNEFIKINNDNNIIEFNIKNNKNTNNIKYLNYISLNIGYKTVLSSFLDVYGAGFENEWNILDIKYLNKCIKDNIKWINTNKSILYNNRTNSIYEVASCIANAGNQIANSNYNIAESNIQSAKIMSDSIDTMTRKISNKL